MLTVRQRADLYCTIGSPKSASSRRDVPLMPILMNTLREWKLAYPKNDLDLVFPTGNGTVHRHANMAEQGFKATQRKAGLVTPDGKPL
jgi:integrase